MKYSTYRKIRAHKKTIQRVLAAVIATVFLVWFIITVLTFMLYQVNAAECETAPEETVPETVEHFAPIECSLPEELQEYTYYMAQLYKVDFELVMAVMYTESSFDMDAYSRTGDYGLMQINEIVVPELADKLYITDIADPYQNIRAGAYILGTYVNRYEYAEQALMSYNMGEYGAATLWENGTHSTEYTDKVIEKYLEYLGGDS